MEEKRLIKNMVVGEVMDDNLFEDKIFLGG